MSYELPRVDLLLTGEVESEETGGTDKAGTVNLR